MTSYYRDRVSDLGNQILNPEQLKTALNANSTLNVTRVCNYISTASDTIEIVFDGTLTNPTQIDALDAVLAAYIYVVPKIAPKNNLTAVVAPTVNDDHTLGYSIQSKWLYNDVMYRCDNASTGAALWVVADIRYQKHVVPIDYPSISAAFNAGAKSVFVKNSVTAYFEFSNINIYADGGQIIGETMGSVKIVLLGGASMKCDGGYFCQ
jgi:hypothetical protein